MVKCKTLVEARIKFLFQKLNNFFLKFKKYTYNAPFRRIYIFYLQC